MRTILKSVFYLFLIVFSTLVASAQPGPEKVTSETEVPCWKCVSCQSMFSSGNICCPCPLAPTCLCFIFTASCTCGGSTASLQKTTVYNAEMKPFDASMDAKQEANTREFENFLSQQRSSNLKNLAPLVRSARENLRGGRIEAYDTVAHRINDTIRDLPAADKNIIIDWLAARGQAYQD